MKAILKDVHYRKNILTDEKVLISPHRAKRPWKGKKEENNRDLNKKEYDPSCYLCPGNKRVKNVTNPNYTETFVFQNDFSALKENTQFGKYSSGLLEAQSEKGICRVICFSPNHSLTLSQLPFSSVINVIKTWQQQFKELSKIDYINNIQIFENKGEIMGCSNPHPHGQIWAQESIPLVIKKKTKKFLNYFQENNKNLLEEYIKQEENIQERVIYSNKKFIVLVPFWATWPFETMILPKRKQENIAQMDPEMVSYFASAILHITQIYDTLFKVSFPYSAGIHQAPTDRDSYAKWHWHLSFYPPLLRSSNVKKFMVGYEMFANPQRDITPEWAAYILKNTL